MSEINSPRSHGAHRARDRRGQESARRRRYLAPTELMVVVNDFVLDRAKEVADETVPVTARSPRRPTSPTTTPCRRW